jgi:hypothetical protein
MYNMAENDFPDKWPTVVQEIHQRLSSNDEGTIISGLRAFKEVIRAYETAIEEERKPLYQLVETFFPLLENLIQYV